MGPLNMASRQIGYFDDGALRAGTGRYLTEIIGALDRTRYHPVFFAPCKRPWHEDLKQLDVELVYDRDAAPEPVTQSTAQNSNAVATRPKLRLPNSIQWTVGTLRDTVRLSRLSSCTERC